MNERECEIQLAKDPTDNEARFRLAEIYVIEEKKLDLAKTVFNKRKIQKTVDDDKI